MKDLIKHPGSYEYLIRHMVEACQYGENVLNNAEKFDIEYGRKAVNFLLTPHTFFSTFFADEKAPEEEKNRRWESIVFSDKLTDEEKVEELLKINAEYDISKLPWENI